MTDGEEPMWMLTPSVSDAASASCCSCAGVRAPAPAPSIAVLCLNVVSGPAPKVAMGIETPAAANAAPGRAATAPAAPAPALELAPPAALGFEAEAAEPPVPVSAPPALAGRVGELLVPLRLFEAAEAATVAGCTAEAARVAGAAAPTAVAAAVVAAGGDVLTVAGAGRPGLRPTGGAVSDGCAATPLPLLPPAGAAAAAGVARCAGFNEEAEDGAAADADADAEPVLGATTVKAGFPAAVEAAGFPPADEAAAGLLAAWPGLPTPEMLPWLPAAAAGAARAATVVVAAAGARPGDRGAARAPPAKAPPAAAVPAGEAASRGDVLPAGGCGCGCACGGACGSGRPGECTSTSRERLAGTAMGRASGGTGEGLELISAETGAEAAVAASAGETADAATAASAAGCSKLITR